MSLTLRDAQHLSWKTYKKFEIKGENLNIDKVIKRLSKIATDLEKKDFKDNNIKNELSKQFSNLVYYAFVLSEINTINLEESFLESMDEKIMNSVF